MPVTTKIKPDQVAAGPLLCRGPRNQAIGKLLADLAAVGKAKDPSEARCDDANLGGMLAAARFASSEDPIGAIKAAAQAVRKTKARDTERTLIALFAVGDLGAARILDHAARTAHCGHDLREDIAADGQFDGEAHDYKCAACRMGHSYRRAED